MAASRRASAPALAQSNVVEKDVEVKTADGTCDAVLFHPAGKGSWPAVLVWPDIMGLRPAFRDMGRRLAAQGYVVLVPNPFYRSAHAPVIGDNFDFSNPEQRARLTGYRAAMTDDGIDHDAQAYLAFLDAQPQTSQDARKAGVQGYCMGGALSFRTAAAVPAASRAVGSFHGGNGLVTKDAEQPASADRQDQRQPIWSARRRMTTRSAADEGRSESRLRRRQAAATVEVYQANHGWCVKGGAVYNEAEAERAWTALSQLYKSNLA